MMSPPVAQTVHERFAAQAASTPARIAVSAHDGELTYACLAAMSDALADRLRSLGVGRNSAVALDLERSVYVTVALLAVMKAGAAYVALPAGLSAAQRGAVIRSAYISVVLTNARTPDLDALGVTTVLVGHQESPHAGESTGSLATADGMNADDLAYVAYTSGSSGAPKGVAVTHGGVLRLLVKPVCGPVSPDDRFLQFAPIAFDASTYEIWVPLLSGARVVFVPPHTPSLSELADFIAEQEVTCLWLTAGLFHQMAETQMPKLAGLRSLVVGGDVVLPKYANKVLADLPHVRLVNGYGPTENTTFTCAHEITTPVVTGPVPIGGPLPGTATHVLNTALGPVRDGEVGELYACGTGLARGYVSAMAPTAGRFVADPFECAAGGRMYRTGDLVRVDDGVLQFCGRSDHEVKINGYRVDLSEVETLLACQPAVRACAVVAHATADGARRVVSFVVPDIQQSPSVTQLRIAAEAVLPEHARPSRYIVAEDLPLTANGKVDRALLERMEPRERPAVYATYAPPASPTEKVLTQMWADLLGVDSVGIDDDFIELGGHSLLGMRISSEIHTVFGVTVGPVAFYTNPTVRQLARFIDEAEPPARPPD
jgi:amino acid adenylation domain-containing protein